LKISANGSIIYPGAGTGIEYILMQKETAGEKYGKHRTIGFISGNIAFYHHPTFHDNLYFTMEWGKRRIKNSGFCYEFDLGPGLSRTFISGTTYKIDDSGNVSKLKLAGYYYAAITAGGGAGYDFSQKKKLPFTAVAKMNFLLMFPYNSTLYVRPVLELGLRYQLKKNNPVR
jgi:ABC-type sugar transport system ATPase subunit